MSPVHGRLLRMTNIGWTDDPIGLLDHPAILNLLGVRYLIVGHWGLVGDWPPPYRTDMAKPKFLSEIEQPGRYPWLLKRHVTKLGTTIFENMRALPLAWMVDRLTVCASPWDAIDRLWRKTEAGRPAFDPLKEALVVGPEIGPRLDALRQGLKPGTARITGRKADRLWLKVSAPQGPSFLVLSEACAPGWWARLDGRLTPIYSANANLRGLFIPRGEHKLYLRYLPLGFTRGAKISLAFAILFAGWVGWIALRGRRVL
jgi:hypothetical protein